MVLNTGDKIVYKDEKLNFFKGEIVDIWKNDDGEKTGYFLVTDTGLYIHFKPGNIESCRLDEPLPEPVDFAYDLVGFE